MDEKSIATFKGFQIYRTLNGWYSVLHPHYGYSKADTPQGIKRLIAHYSPTTSTTKENTK